ncbi:MAG: ABC transporter ATP-binding protein [Bacillota bacterium]
MLRVEDLRVTFHGAGTPVPALGSVSFALSPGRVTAVLGESGSGKSVLAKALMGLLPRNCSVEGSMVYQDRELLTLGMTDWLQLRGREMVLIPQSPLSHLNPVFSVAYQVGEAVQRSGVTGKASTRARVMELLAQVGFPDARAVARLYPHQLSGGMAQRVLMAIGLAGRPRVVIADEPTRGLDTAARDRICSLLLSLFADAAVFIITHDLEVAELCDEVIVLYAGEIVESGPRWRIMQSPTHPYTAGLLRAHPERGMVPIEGQTPSITELPDGCRFHPRCAEASEPCRMRHPGLFDTGEVKVRCFRARC